MITQAPAHTPVRLFEGMRGFLFARTVERQLNAGPQQQNGMQNGKRDD
jgi:hypothetical protein